MRPEIHLRRETPADEHAVEALTREAFWNLHGPGCDEHYLVHVLRGAKSFIPALHFVAVLGGRIAGSIMYTHAQLVLDAGGVLPVITFGPISVLPELQGQGIGGMLITHTLALARQAGHSAVLIYGDPAYYCRFNFLPAEHFGIATSNNQYHAALQAVELQPHALQHAQGRFLEDAVYHVDAAAAAAYDLTFPPKETHSGTPSQLRFQEIIQMHRPRE